MTGDMWQVTGDRWDVTCDTWHVTCLVRWTFSQNFSLPFVIYDIMKIWRKRMTRWINELMNESINGEAVYRTAPATPGLLTTWRTRKMYEEGNIKCNMENVPRGHIIHSNQINIWNVNSKYRTTTDHTKRHMKIHTMKNQ